MCWFRAVSALFVLNWCISSVQLPFSFPWSRKPLSELINYCFMHRYNRCFPSALFGELTTNACVKSRKYNDMLYAKIVITARILSDFDHAFLSPVKVLPTSFQIFWLHLSVILGESCCLPSDLFGTILIYCLLWHLLRCPARNVKISFFLITWHQCNDRHQISGSRVSLLFIANYLHLLGYDW